MFVPCSVLTVASWPACRFHRRQVRWSGIPISFRFSTVCFDPHSQRLSCSQWSRSRFFFWNSLAFSMIQQSLAIWALVPLPFLNQALTSGSFGNSRTFHFNVWQNSLQIKKKKKEKVLVLFKIKSVEESSAGRKIQVAFPNKNPQKTVLLISHRSKKELSRGVTEHTSQN